MLLVIPTGVLLGWWLTTTRWRGVRLAVEILATLPLVLPPTVVGLALLWLLGNGSAVGRWLNDVVGVRLLFTWQAATLASAVMSFPLFFRPVMGAFQSVDRDLVGTARVHGASDFRVLTLVYLPLSFRGLLAGLTLAFARALGEFGATLMVAGSIPGETRTLSLALYSSVEEGNFDDGLRLAGVVVLLSVGILLGLRSLEHRMEAKTAER